MVQHADLTVVRLVVYKVLSLIATSIPTDHEDEILLLCASKS